MNIENDKRIRRLTESIKGIGHNNTVDTITL